MSATTATESAPNKWVRHLTGPIRRVLNVLLSVALTFLGLTCVTFFIGRIVPIDPVLAIVGDKASRATYDRVAAEIGVNLPIPVQYWRYLKKVLHADFGVSLITAHPVMQDMTRVFPATMELAVLALLVGTLFGVPLGVIAATHRGRWQDQLIRFGSLLGYSMPVFWLGLVGLLLFYARLGWVEGPGRLDVSYDDIVQPVTGLITIDSLIAGETEVFWNALSHIILPSSILGYGSMAYISRMTRSFMLEQLSQEYVIAARVKGMSRWKVIWRHAFRNILVQLVTIIALAYAFLLEGAVLTETVFAWPGFGRYLTSGLLAGDMNAVLACVLIIGMIFIALNLLADVLYRILDPRTR